MMLPAPALAAQVPFESNLLLQALAKADRAFVEPYLQSAEFLRGDVLFRVGDEVSHVTFPLSRTIVTFVLPLRDGKSVETATVGHEGALGGVVSQGYLPAFSQAVVQVGGPAVRIEAERLNEAKQASPAVHDLFVRYADCLVAQLLQSVACNAVHPIEQRCLRWLLTMQDRLGTDDLPVTHEMLAEMMGVRRAYLTKVLGQLQRDGLIRISRGRLRLINRARIKQSACECHGNVRRHFQDVLGAVYGRAGEIVALDARHPEDLHPPVLGVLAKPARTAKTHKP